MGGVNGRLAEKSLSKKIGARRTSNSGAGKWQKGDMVRKLAGWGFARVDLKCTAKDRYIFHMDDFIKLEKKCKASEVPTFMISFCSKDRIDFNRTYILMREADWGMVGSPYYEAYKLIECEGKQMPCIASELKEINLGWKRAFKVTFRKYNASFMIVCLSDLLLTESPQ